MINKPKHKVFSLMVKSEKDIAGMIAYCIYKRKKIEFLEQKHKESGGNLSEDNALQFIEVNSMDGQINAHKEQANNVLKEYGNILLQRKLNEIEKYYRARKWNRFAWGVAQSIVGSFLFTILVGVLFIFLWSFQLGMEEILEHIFNIEITNKKI